MCLNGDGYMILGSYLRKREQNDDFQQRFAMSGENNAKDRAHQEIVNLAKVIAAFGIRCISALLITG